MRKTLLIGTALAALSGASLLATASFAADTTTTHTQTQVDAETLVGMDVVNAEGENIGEVANVVIDADGKVRHVIVSVGGFLGIGEKDVALAWDDLMVAPDGASVTVPYTKDQLTALPEHAYPDSVERGTVYAYDDDVKVNGYLASERQATAEAAQQTGEAVAETTAGVTTNTAVSTTAQSGAIAVTDAARIQASDLLGADVQTANGESVGAIDDFWLDANGQVAGVVVDVGGYFGIGADPVLLAWSDLQFRHDGDDVMAITLLSRDQLESLTNIQKSSN